MQTEVQDCRESSILVETIIHSYWTMCKHCLKKSDEENPTTQFDYLQNRKRRTETCLPVYRTLIETSIIKKPVTFAAKMDRPRKM
jgi:hypothetical protein